MSKFNLLSYILPPEDKLFFARFQELSQICFKTATLFNEIIQNHLDEEHKELALKKKKKGKFSYKAVLKELNKSFITPIEREDIQTIAVQLNKINKEIAKACLHLEVYRINNYTKEMKEQASTLLEATNKLCEIISKFKKVSDTNEMTQLNIEMKEIESRGDEIHREALHDLYSGKYETLEVIKLRDMYQDIEDILDACYYVADTIFNVVLKQS